MKRKQIIQVIDASTSRTSNVLDLGDLTKTSVHVIFTGSDVVGTLKLQASNNESDWEDVPETNVNVTGSINHMWNVNFAHYQFLRIDWAYIGGSGNISAIAIIKENPVTGA